MARCVRFRPLFLIPGSRRRVAIPCPSLKTSPFTLASLGLGAYRLIPWMAIPRHQRWVWAHEVRESIEKSLTDYHAGKAIALDGPEGRIFWAALGDEP